LIPGKAVVDLIECDAASRSFSPDHVAGQAPSVCRQNQAKAIGNPYRTGDVQRRSRMGHIADRAIDGFAAELDSSGLPNPVSSV
jgi:hypothetical protein